MALGMVQSTQRLDAELIRAAEQDPQRVCISFRSAAVTATIRNEQRADRCREPPEHGWGRFGQGGWSANAMSAKSSAIEICNHTWRGDGSAIAREGLPRASDTPALRRLAWRVHRDVVHGSGRSFAASKAGGRPPRGRTGLAIGNAAAVEASWEVKSANHLRVERHPRT
jgi:hypothetical protein